MYNIMLKYYTNKIWEIIESVDENELLTLDSDALMDLLLISELFKICRDCEKVQRADETCRHCTHSS